MKNLKSKMRKKETLHKRTGIAYRKKKRTLQIPRDKDVTELIENLRTRQVELEMQEEKLKTTQLKLKESIEGHFDFYNLAPCGILTIDKNGLIINSNLTFSNMVGIDSSKLINKKFSSIIAKESQDVFSLNHKKIIRTKKKLSCELVLIKNNKHKIVVQIDCIPYRDTKSKTLQIIATIIEVTQLRRLVDNFHESSAWYNSIFEGSRDAIFISDADSRFVAVNEMACKLTGYSAEELQEMQMPDILADTDLEVYQKYQDKIMSGDDLISEVRILRKDKSQLDTEFNSRSITIAGKLYTHTTARDITERKVTEQALEKDQESFRNLFENTTIGIYRTTPDGKILLVNPALVAMLGYKSAEELLNRDIEKQGYRDQEMRKLFKKILEKEDIVYGFEAEWEKRDGTIIYVSESAKAIRDGNNNVKYYEGTVKDITEQKQAQEKLIMSERRFRELFEDMSSGVAVYDVIGDGSDFIFRDFNKAGERIDNDKREDILGKSIFEVGPGVEVFGLIDVFKRVWKTGKPEHFPISEYKDKKLIGWYENYIYKLPCGEIVTIFDNITEKKQIEEALSESEESFRNLFENATIGIFRTTPDGKILLVNPALVAMLGYKSAEELLNRDIEKQGYRDQEMRKLFKKILKKEDIVYGFEAEWEKRDGTIIYVSESAKAIRDSNNNVKYYEGTVKDITEQRQAENALRESEEKYRTLVENASDQIFMVSRDFKMLSINEAALKLLGKTKNEIIGKHLSEIYTKEIYEKNVENIEKVFKTGAALNVEETHIIGDNQYWFSTQFNPLITIENQVIAIMGIVRDITERKLSEEKLKIAYNHLKNLSIRLQTIREDERAAIARDIHDDMGQVLTALKIELSLIRTEIISKRESLDCSYILDEMEEMQNMINVSMNSVRRLIRELRPEVLDNLGLIKALQLQIEEFEKRTQIKSVFRSIPEEPNIDKIKSIAIYRIVQEALTNISRHSNARNIEITVIEEKESIKLDIKDDGIGFDKEKLHDKKTLGLVSMKERAFILGGEFKIESAEGMGTTILVFFPKTESDSIFKLNI